MTATAAAVRVRREVDTVKAKVAHMALRHGEDILQDYSLAMLTYVQDYEFGPRPEVRNRRYEESTFDYLMFLAAEGLLVNFTTLHRAITEVKRDMQTPRQRRAALRREAFWGEAMGWRE